MHIPLSECPLRPSDSISSTQTNYLNADEIPFSLIVCTSIYPGITNPS